MIKPFSLLLVLLLPGFSQANAQDTIGFENFALPLDTFLYQADPPGTFVSGAVVLPNFFDPTYGFWSGWSLSTMRDTLTPGYGNSFSVISGEGANHSDHYAVTYCSPSCTVRLGASAAGTVILGFYLNNTTYTYLSMRDGDAFAKRFGGETGTDPDFLSVTVHLYRDGELLTDSLVVYLADFRADDVAEDRLLHEWTYTDLSALGGADSILFTMQSSDVGIYGINTPTYFALDNVVVSTPVSARHQNSNIPLSLFPNPARDWITLPSGVGTNPSYRIYDLSGREYTSGSTKLAGSKLDVHALPAGFYLLKIESAFDHWTGKFIIL
ncbi:MAG: DUF4465 domain-containing protein [Saprospiraceae bacterium]